MEILHEAQLKSLQCLQYQAKIYVNAHESRMTVAWCGFWQVVAETQDLIAVHKPASMPVHACGQYRKNTVMALLQMGRPDLGKLFPVHRLDKPVSGLLLIAKTAAAAKAVGTQITVSLYSPGGTLLVQPWCLTACLKGMLLLQWSVSAGSGQLTPSACCCLLCVSGMIQHFTCFLWSAGARRSAQNIHCPCSGVLS